MTAHSDKRFEHALSLAQHQVRNLITRHPGLFPTYTIEGRWNNPGERWTDWCAGFLPGMMWNFFSATKDPWWQHQAVNYCQLLEHRKSDRNVHDLGFIFLNSYRRWYEASGDDWHMDTVVEAGRTLARRFQDKGQYLASFLGPNSLFIDIMMNVPLLFVAADWLDSRDGHISRPTMDRGNPSESTAASLPANFDLSSAELRRIATAHCTTSQKYLVRDDGSTAHEAIFDPDTGEFLRQTTQQGLRPDSCWARGLAWSLYGFGTVYRLTRDPQFWDTANRCADYFIDHLPAGRIPYWDFDLPPDADRLWDSSAGAIAASGLLQLAALSDLGTTPTDQAAQRRARYHSAAFEILDALCEDEFLASSVPGWEGILRHGVYHIHKGLGVDESVMWGDHFFVEALTQAVG